MTQKLGPKTFSTGREAYEDDCKHVPTYHDGGPRCSWDQLTPIARWSWDRSPSRRLWVERLPLRVAD